MGNFPVTLIWQQFFLTMKDSISKHYSPLWRFYFLKNPSLWGNFQVCNLPHNVRYHLQKGSPQCKMYSMKIPSLWGTLLYNSATPQSKIFQIDFFRGILHCGEFLCIIIPPKKTYIVRNFLSYIVGNSKRESAAVEFR